MYRLIACKGELMFNQLIAKGIINHKIQELTRCGYTIVSCELEKSLKFS